MVDKIDVSRLLRDADPLNGRDDEGLSPVDAQRIRRHVVAAVEEPPQVARPWGRSLAVAITVMLLVVLGGVSDDRTDHTAATTTPGDAVSLAAGGGGERRQLQFSTPGGTRIIWVFDPDLRLQEPMP